MPDKKYARKDFGDMSFRAAALKDFAEMLTHIDGSANNPLPPSSVSLIVTELIDPVIDLLSRACLYAEIPEEEPEQTAWQCRRPGHGRPGYFKECAMSIDIKIDEARAALLALGDLAFCMDDGSAPAEKFGFGLSVLLGYVAKELEEAKSELSRRMENARQGNTGGSAE